MKFFSEFFLISHCNIFSYISSEFQIITAMKSTLFNRLFIVLGVLVMALTPGCSKDNGGDDNGDDNGGGGGGGVVSKVTLKGKFSGTKAGGVSSATKVLIFDYNSDYVVSNIVNGAFSIQVNNDEPVGMLFTNEAKEFLGFLTLNQGFESLPLSFLNDTVSVVDFGILQESVQQVTPQSTFDFGKFQMSLEQKQIYGQASLNFSIMIRNPDINRNGILDILEGKRYRISFLFFMKAVEFNRAGQPGRELSTQMQEYSIMLNSKDSPSPGASEVRFILPSGISVYCKEKKTLPEDGSTMYFSGNIITMPESGVTKIIYGNDTLYYDVPAANQAMTLDNMISLHPNFTVTSGNLTEISWNYYKGNTSTIVNPENIIYVTQVQVAGQDYSNIWENNQISPDKNKVVLPTPIEYSKVRAYFIGYYNHFGNNVITGYWPK